MDKYYIVATIHPKAGKEEAVKAEILKNIPNVRKETGCLRYDLHVRKTGGDTFMLYEIWADKAAFEAHGLAPHMAAYRERTKDLFEKPAEVSVWSAVEAAL
ncbi:MAG: antibiotic biosynthesis monooxygenase [Desulfovibrionaceae bacterium]|nr:antibiotic biosynthesis monooxygenase [Desulfovibrionaceae bacterium]